jgi:acetyl-CoA C-acetyltransferase
MCCAVPGAVAGGTADLYEVKPIDLLSQCLQAFQRRTDRPDLPAAIDDFVVGVNTPAG